MKKNIISPFFIVLILVGCIPYTRSIAPDYENREKLYRIASCAEVHATLDQTEQSLENLGEQQDQNAWNDTIYIILGMVWRPLFTINNAEKIAKLKGDKEILQELLNRCR